MGFADSASTETCSSALDVARRVILVGIAGPSCGGKSTLAETLAVKLGSPLTPISLDAYFMPQRMPRDKYGRNWETPAGVDFDTLREDLEHVQEIMSQVSEVPKKLVVRGNPHRGGGDIVRPGHELQRLDDVDPVVVVIEGFLLFHDEKLSCMFDASLWLDVGEVECCERRYNREARDMDKNIYKQWFKDVVWKHFQLNKKQQLSNATNVLRLDGAAEMDSIVERATEHCKEQLALWKKLPLDAQ